MIMELGSVLLVTLVSLVNASPYGYGVKGGSGAVARAEASATAGALSGFGAVPVAFPASVGGYSGSYSKSSSSSFASSSASASSESFAFSGGSAGGFSSAGSGGLATFGNNGSEGKAGCGKSDCSGVGLNYQGSSGNGLQSYSGANTIAGAGGVIGLPSFSTHGASQPCLSGDCTKQTPYSCTGSSCTSENKCLSGHCGTSLSTSSSASDLGTYNPDSQNLGYNKDTSNNFYSNCAHGNCNTNPKTTDYAYGNQKPICNSPGCSSSNTYKSASNNAPSVVSNNLQVPASYLTTPNSGSGLDGIGCAGISCQKKVYDTNVENNQNLPSSYDVPSYTVTASDFETPKCYSGNCDSKISQNSYNKSTYYEIKPQDTIKYSSGTKCISPNCAESAEDIKVTNSYSANTQRPASFGCKSGNCATYPSGEKPSFTTDDANINNCGSSTCGSKKPTYPAYEPNYSSTPFPSYSSGASDSTSNVYVSSDSTSSLIHATGNNNHFKPTSQNNNDLPSTLSPTYTQSSTIDTYIVPSSGSSHNIPTTGNILSSPDSGLSYIAPSASYSPSSIQPTKGSTSYNSFSHGNTFHTAPESSDSSSTTSSNYNTVSKEISHSAPLSDSHYATTAPSVGHVSPSLIPTSYTPSSISSGYTPSSGSFIPASNNPSYNLPTTSTGYTFSNTDSVATSGLNSESHTHITSLPSSSVSLKPAAVYTGSFGGPPGLLKPNDYTVPQKPAGAQQRPFAQQPYSTTTTLSPSKPIKKGTIPCSSGNCEHFSSHFGHAISSSDTDSKSVAYTGGFGGSPGLLSPSSSVNSQTPTLSTKPSVAHGVNADASVSSNAVIYTGGFGGPPGILKPYDTNNVGSSITDQSSTHYSTVPKGISNTPHIGVLPGASAQSDAPAGANIGDLSQSSSHQPSTGSCTGTTCGLEYDGGNTNQAYSPSGAFASGTALANAEAGTSSGTSYNLGHDYSSEAKHGAGCNGGCGVNHGSGYGGYGLSNSGSYSTSLGGGFGVAGATAKSSASAAGSGVGSYGGSFASSSAHASAGAGTKGGYGRK